MKSEKASKPASRPAAEGNTKENPPKKKKVKGIILLVLGAISVLGSFSNGFYWSMLEYGMDLADLTVIVIQAALVIFGVRSLSGPKN